MGAKGAVEIVFRGRTPDEQAKEVANYEKLFANPLTAARRGYIDDIIQPSETRRRLCQELDALYHKDLKNPAKKHGNLPL